ncbi:hypothetical protein GGR91_000288 [Sphingorhabdus rigui]|uniref:Uncharacterized protein n=1 Tax=Sphingorhabdus rigui TaxID=1282858 RepID=A0A840AYL3_9SPHN|nr:hypothetical protein [Sphingorhabdus rigui]MBB3942066.1 hypothetical protein [Sphingorhabdus rigui]
MATVPALATQRLARLNFSEGEAAKRAFDAMAQMVKIDVAVIEAAMRG